MTACRRVRPWLEWLAADELDNRRRVLAEAHLRECPACSREFSAWRSLLAAAARPDAATAAELQAIDWNEVSEKIIARIETRPRPGRRTAPLLSLAFLSAAAALVAIVGLGVFFWARSNRASGHPAGNGPIGENLQGGLSAPAAGHLQSGLARAEMISYLRQSQLMLTDLLNDCAGDEAAPWELRLYSRQAKELLLKKKYFQQSLPAAEWLKVRNVSERIDWLNYEILQLEGERFCTQLNRLQRIMEHEKLLLKIRLLERDLSGQPFQEV